MAIIAAASITQDSGFHINPKYFNILLSCKDEKKENDEKGTAKI